MASSVAGSKASVFAIGAQPLLPRPAPTWPHRMLSTRCLRPAAWLPETSRKKAFPSDSGGCLGTGLASVLCTLNPALRLAAQSPGFRPEPHTQGG